MYPNANLNQPYINFARKAQCIFSEQFKLQGKIIGSPFDFTCVEWTRTRDLIRMTWVPNEHLLPVSQSARYLQHIG